MWLAYRKAKKEAFYNNTAPYGLKFVAFEKELQSNLEKLHNRLHNEEHPWADDAAFLGGISLVPKSLEPFADGKPEPHFRESDPLTEWKRTHNKTKRAKASVRLVIASSVEYLIISTLWALKVGEKYERSLQSPGVYANRLRRRFRKGTEGEEVEVGAVNWDSHSLYQSFSHQYGRWRRDGMKATRADLEAGARVVGIALDISSFYDSIDPAFLLSQAFLKRMQVELSQQERALTEAMIRSCKTWCSQAGRACGIPIGLPSSGLIANLLLGPFDGEVCAKLEPSFYGRFVDDIYLSLRSETTFKDGNTLLNWLVKRIPWLTKQDDHLQLRLPYAAGSDIRLSSKKQRVFMLEGEAGKDVLTAIEEHMRTQASAHRMLPTLPDNDTEMKERALLLNRDAGLAMAVFREADFVTLKKAGLSEELSKMERISEVLAPGEWLDVRKSFYELACRHLLAPSGFVEFYTFLPRVVGLMGASRDWDAIGALLAQVSKLRQVLADTTDLEPDQLRQIFANLAKRIELAALKCCLGLNAEELRAATKAIHEIRNVGEIDVEGVTEARVKQYGKHLYFADWSRQPFYRPFLEKARQARRQPSFPMEIEAPMHIPKLRVALAEMRASRLSDQNWRGLLFPTRPMPLSEISCRLGWKSIVGYARRSARYKGRHRFADWVLAIRGVRLNRWVTPRPILISDQGPVGIRVGPKADRPIRIAITNVLTELSAWSSAASGTPMLTRERFTRLTRLINTVLQHEPLPDILVLPELSLPRSLERSFVERLGRSGIALVAGLEYGPAPGKRGGLLNQAVITIDLGSGYGQLQLRQTKNAAAWEEAAQLAAEHDAHVVGPEGGTPDIPIYRSRGLYFGLLICSDLTNPRYRSHFQGLIDALFVLEWNPDIASFNSLIEASALDVHAYIVQTNNREYGDGRIRGPMKQSYKRDVIQLKGGIHDYFVVGEIDPINLRSFQSANVPDLDDKAVFKPFPIKFKIAPWRKVRP